MKVFLLVMAVWSIDRSGEKITPTMIKEMPDMAACEAVAKAIVEMSSETTNRTRCIQAFKDYN